jgi:hypothetical protein
MSSDNSKPTCDHTTPEQLKASPRPVVNINRPLRVPKKFQHAPPITLPDTNEGNT